MTISSRLIDSLRSAKRVAVLTGAGISAESGVPTFRDAQTGLWAKFSPQELATPTAFRRNPKLVWEWYQWRRNLVSKAKPNPGHQALVDMESIFPSFTLITQNVDGLHRLAGSKNIIELHGNIQRTKCFQENAVVDSWTETDDVPPKCPRCGGLLRPDVVWFEEPLPEMEIQAAINASCSSDVFLSIGTSSLVYPAASLPIEALRNHAIVVEINVSETSLSNQAHYMLKGPAGEILPELVSALKK